MIPADYWNLNCWTFRQDGHSIFSCPYLTAEQRLYFAYKYYLHQVKANPQVAKYLEEKLQWRISNDRDKDGVADQVVSERTRNGDERRGN